MPSSRFLPFISVLANRHSTNAVTTRLSINGRVDSLTHWFYTDHIRISRPFVKFEGGKIMLRVTKTENGRVRGIPAADPRITAFKGIPFAAPPVGELRWKGPALPPTGKASVTVIPSAP